MKRYIMLTSSLLVAAIILTTVVFCLVLQYQVDTVHLAPVAVESPELGDVENPDDSASQSISTTTDEETSSLQYEPIPLRDLDLTPAQATVAEFIGLDVATASITSAMQACAVSLLGEARVSEIVVGATPSMVEMWQLKGCL